VTLAAENHVVEHLVKLAGSAFIVLGTHFGTRGPACESVNTTPLFYRRLEHPLDLCGRHDGPPLFQKALLIV
jgi:hypothetical protein